MPLLVYKISDYEHIAEREQYRTLCKQLKSLYDKNQEICIFIANYNIFDCEFDGIVIKSNAIIAVEFKNFGGEVLAVENGHWHLSDGTIIKGGSNKSVYQQAKLNHVALKRGLKEGNILSAAMLKNIPSLIVFAHPIVLTNKLGERTKSWLHICDNDHFIEKIEDITAPKFYLTNEKILDLISKLDLIEEFADTRFTAVENLFSIDNCLGNDNCTVKNKSGVIESPLSSLKRNNNPVELKEPQEDSIKESLRDFLTNNVIPLLNIDVNYSLHVVDYQNYTKVIGIKLPFQSDYVAIFNSLGVTKYINVLQRIFHKNVIALSDTIIVWPEGDVQSSEIFINTKIPQKSFQSLPRRNNEEKELLTPQEITVLPEWLDNLIFNSLGGKYQPSHERFSYNLDLTNDEAKIYLGTYFPRSFAESHLIFNHICNSSIIQSEILEKSEIRILDFGCGSGGATFGIIHSIESFVPDTKNIRIIGVDGNQSSLRLLDKITRFYNSRGKLNIHLDIVPCYIESEEDFNDIADVIGLELDFIVTSKAIGEFERKKHISQNGYEFFPTLFAPLLSKNGVMVIIDVTTKDEASGLYLSQRMNIGVNNFLSRSQNQFKSLAPCEGLLDGHACGRKCFFKKEVIVSHSGKSKDLSKFAVRILSRKESPLNKSIFQNQLRNLNCVI